MRVIYPALVFAIVLAGCSKPAPKVEVGASETSSSLIPKAAPIPFNEAEFHKLSDRVKTLEADEDFRSMVERMDGSVFLKPDDKSWQEIKTQLGYLAISLDNVSEYANGS